MTGNTSAINHCPNYHTIANGNCDAKNLHRICEFDGFDCCSNASLIDNGECDPVNFNNFCNFDGNDCSRCDGAILDWSCCSHDSPCGIGQGDCDSNIDCAGGLICGKDNCGPNSPHQSYDCCVENDLNISETDLCPNSANVGNGICNTENKNIICNYDGGDCCPNSDLINNAECDYINNNHACLYDGGDCCFEYSGSRGTYLYNDGQCSYIHNLEMCNFDGGDCCDNFTIADGICDDRNNNRICHYDGGDCCYGNKTSDRCHFCRCIESFDVIEHPFS